MRPTRLLLLVLAFVVAGAWPAGAHTSLLSSDPADGARLDTAPEQVVLTFSEPIREPSEASVQVDGRTLEAQVSVDGPRLVVTPASPAGGSYEINYRVVSADGHPVSGTTTFDVTSGPTVEPTEAAAASSVSDENGGVPTVLWIVLGGIVVVGALAFALLRRPKVSRDHH